MPGREGEARVLQSVAVGGVASGAAGEVLDVREGGRERVQRAAEAERHVRSADVEEARPQSPDRVLPDLRQHLVSIMFEVHFN